MDGGHLDSCEEDGEQRRGMRLFTELRKRVREKENTKQEGTRGLPEVGIKDGKKCEWESHSHTKKWLIKRE